MAEEQKALEPEDRLRSLESTINTLGRQLIMAKAWSVQVPEHLLLIVPQESITPEALAAMEQSLTEKLQQAQAEFHQVCREVRDTHFQQFARLLVDELLEGGTEVSAPFTDDWPEEAREIIALRAYDLVAHVLAHANPEWECKPWDIPDLTAWPGEQ